jgi:hypothetical protein
MSTRADRDLGRSQFPQAAILIGFVAIDVGAARGDGLWSAALGRDTAEFHA